MSDPRPHLYLASRSPRRAELLRQIGVRFVVASADVDESVYPGERAEGYVRRVAQEKAEAVWRRLEDDASLPVLAADTAVVVGDRILGKPRDGAEARDMLRALSGRSHQVLTAVTLALAGRSRSVLSDSRVTFRRLSEAEIDGYWLSREPADKAGAYAIQGLGALFIARLEGSYSGVMGLPLFETGQLLAEAGLSLVASGDD